jgi:MFS family permease
MATETLASVEASGLAARPAPLLNKTILLFMAAMVLANLGGEMYGPLLPLYLKSLNASVAQIGLFFTLSQIIPLALQILGGWVSDSLGRLRSIAIGSVAGMITYAALLWAPTWELALVSMAFSALTRSLVGPSFGAFIAEQSTEQNRARLYGATETIFMVIGVIGPPLGGFLAQGYGFRFMLTVAWGFYTIATVIRVMMARRAADHDEAKPRPMSVAGLRKDLGLMLGMLVSGGIVTWILVTDGVRDIAFTLSGNLFPLYMDEQAGLNLQEIGWLSSLFGVAMMLVTLPAGWLADRVGERVMIAAGFILQFLGLLAFVELSGFWGIAVAWSVLGLGVGVMSPAYQALVSKAVPEKMRGTAFGLFSTSLGLVSLPAPAVGAQMWERVTPRFPFQVTAWLSLLAVIPVWWKFRLSKQDTVAQQAPEASG